MRNKKHYKAEHKSDAMKTGKERGANKDDPFLLLPEELLLSILNKLPDLKHFCQCSLLSKRFASVISHIQTVSHTVPSSGPLTIESSTNVRTLVCKLQLPSSKPVPAILEFLSHQNLKIPIFLEKLQEVKSIHLEYLHPKNADDSHLPSPKWKVEFNDNIGKIESYASLLPISVRRKTEDDPNEESLEVSRELMENQILTGFWLPCIRYVEWMCLVYMLAKNHTALTSVTVTDSEKQSKLVMREEDLSKLRSSGVKEILKQPWYTGKTVKMARVPVLHLPLSGYVMRWPFLLWVTPDDESCSKDRNMREMIFSDFEEDEQVLGEAIKEIVKKHGHEIHTFPRIHPTLR